jgi:hypothetical protein
MMFVESLEFQKKLPWQDDIHAVATIQIVAFVEQRQGNLALMGNAKSMQFQAERCLVIRLIQSRTELPMNGQRSTDDIPSNVVAEVGMFDGFHF